MEILENTTTTIQNCMDKAYALAIDHAIKTVGEHCIPGQPLLNQQLVAIVAKLKTLKK